MKTIVNSKQLLTSRQIEILDNMSRYPNLLAKQIADKMYISTHTFNTHVRNIKKIVGLNSKTALVLWYINIYNSNNNQLKAA